MWTWAHLAHFIIRALLVSKTTDIPQKALFSTDLHWTNNVPHCTGYWYIYCTSMYVSTDLYRTVLNNTLRFYWLALYSTEQRCTFWLTRTVQHWTTLYRKLTCTVHYWIIQNGYTYTHCTLLYNTEQEYRHILYTTVQYLTHYNLILFTFFNFYS